MTLNIPLVGSTSFSFKYLAASISSRSKPFPFRPIGIPSLTIFPLVGQADSANFSRAPSQEKSMISAFIFGDVLRSLQETVASRMGDSQWRRGYLRRSFPGDFLFPLSAP